jgi:hypothetical protein
MRLYTAIKYAWSAEVKMITGAQQAAVPLYDTTLYVDYGRDCCRFLHRSLGYFDTAGHYRPTHDQLRGKVWLLGTARQ